MSDESRCKGCHAVIRWIQTPKGKWMPVNPEHVVAWVVNDVRPSQAAPPAPRRLTLLSGDGRLMETGLVATIHEPGAREICGYVPHWVTCPNREQFKTEAR